MRSANRDEDYLTGLLNRAAFGDCVERLVRRIGQGEGSAALAMFAIDGFTRITARHGEATGVMILQLIASEARLQLRPGDGIARLGGDSFALLLPGADRAAAERCAERLRAAIERTHVSDCPRVTGSLGIAVFEQGMAPAQWLERAAAALDDAKASGGNRCAVSESRLEVD